LSYALTQFTQGLAMVPHFCHGGARVPSDKLCRGGDLLMANVFGSGGVNRIFGDVGGMVADAFEVTRDKHQIDIAA
jgi:hypothetical protein